MAIVDQIGINGEITEAKKKRRREEAGSAREGYSKLKFIARGVGRKAGGT